MLLKSTVTGVTPSKNIDGIQEALDDQEETDFKMNITLN